MYEKQSRNTNRSADTIASFLLKTYEILEHPEYERMISWDKSNVGFIIHDVALFTRQILPKYFRHSNFSSFVRQLNMYDFHKVKQQNESLVFKNPLFCKGEQQNLKFIRRKAAKKVGGQRRQHSSEKNEVQNEKYENLLKGFKKSIESEINQSALFYERSIHLIKELNESNLKKQNYIRNLYTTDEKIDTTEQIKSQEPEPSEENAAEEVTKPKKDTIIQIPREFLEPEQISAQNPKENKIQEKEKTKILNLDNIMLLKEQVYKSLGTYQSWIQDYIETQRKKIKFINGYRQQLIKCKQTKIAENIQNQDQQNEGQNFQDNSNSNVENYGERPNSKSLGEGIENVKYKYRRNNSGESESMKKMENMNVIQENESQSLICKLENKKSNRGFLQPSKDQNNDKQNFIQVVNPVQILSIGQRQFESKLFSAFSKSFQQKSAPQKQENHLEYEDKNLKQNLVKSQSNEEVHGIQSPD